MGKASRRKAPSSGNGSGIGSAPSNPTLPSDFQLPPGLDAAKEPAMDGTGPKSTATARPPDVGESSPPTVDAFSPPPVVAPSLPTVKTYASIQGLKSKFTRRANTIIDLINDAISLLESSHHPKNLNLVMKMCETLRSYIKAIDNCPDEIANLLRASPTLSTPATQFLENKKKLLDHLELRGYPNLRTHLIRLVYEGEDFIQHGITGSSRSPRQSERSSTTSIEMNKYSRNLGLSDVESSNDWPESSDNDETSQFMEETPIYERRNRAPKNTPYDLPPTPPVQQGRSNPSDDAHSTTLRQIMQRMDLQEHNLVELQVNANIFKKEVAGIRDSNEKTNEALNALASAVEKMMSFFMNKQPADSAGSRQLAKAPSPSGLMDMPLTPPADSPSPSPALTPSPALSPMNLLPSAPTHGQQRQGQTCTSFDPSTGRPTYTSKPNNDQEPMMISPPKISSLTSISPSGRIVDPSDVAYIHKMIGSIPKFDGNRDDYKIFINTFNSLVGNTDMNPEWKHTILLQLLSGDARACISSSKISAEDYKNLLDELELLYNKSKDRLDINERKFKTLPFHQTDYDEMKLDLMKHYSVANILRDEGIAVNDKMFIQILVDKLPPALMRRANKYINKIWRTPSETGKAKLTFYETFKTIQNEISEAEALDRVQKNRQRSLSHEVNVVKQKSPQYVSPPSKTSEQPTTSAPDAQPNARKKNEQVHVAESNEDDDGFYYDDEDDTAVRFRQ